MPLIKPYEIPRYFAKEVVQLPNFSKDKLDDILGPLLSPVPSHNSLVEATTVIACWLAQTQRESAYLTQGKFSTTIIDPTRKRSKFIIR